jgi:hypothetical protein
MDNLVRQLVPDWMERAEQEIMMASKMTGVIGVDKAYEMVSAALLRCASDLKLALNQKHCRKSAREIWYGK